MISRRDSTISYCVSGGRNVVVKTYHSRYSVEEEEDKLAQLQIILGQTPLFRCVEVVKITSDSLMLEWIEGSSMECLKKEQLIVLLKYRGEIIELLTKCYQEKFSFDSDLSNIIYHKKRGELVFIDPVQKDMGIDHSAFIVFSLSILKSLGKSRNPFLVIQKIRCFVQYFRLYTRKKEIDSQQVKEGFCSYIDIVIGWNKEFSETEGFLLRRVRQFCLVPTWRFLKVFFK